MLAHNARFAIFLLTLVTGLMWTVPPVQAAVVYVYTDETGKIHYSDYLSTIPKEYRSKARAKYVPGKKSSKTTTQGEAGDSQDSTATSTSSKTTDETKPKKVGLSAEEEALMNEGQGVMKEIISLANNFQGIPMNFTNGRRMVMAIQSKMQMKIDFAKKIGDSKEALLQSAKQFLIGSIAEDEKDKAVKSGLKMRLTSIKNRLVSDSEQAATLMVKMKAAVADSQAKKQAAKLKEAEEKKKKEGKSESTEEKTADQK